MADNTLFTLRPVEGKSETLDGAFRIHFHPDDLKALHLSLGDPCLLKNQAGKEGVGVAWRSLTAKNRRLINVGHVLREAFEFSIGDKLTVSRSDKELPPAKQVVVRQLSSLELTTDLDDVTFLARCALVNIEAIWSGGHFDVSLKHPQPAKVRFTIEQIDGQQGLPKVPTPWSFRPGTLLQISQSDRGKENRQADSQHALTSVDFSGIGGLEKQLEELRSEIQNIEIPLEVGTSSTRYPQYGHPRMILLHGAPGTGKSLVLSKMSSRSFRHVERLRLSSTQGVKATQTVSRAFADALSKEPSMLVIDNIDEIAGRDSEVAQAILGEIDCLGSEKLRIIAAARHRNNIHDRLRSKFDCEIELPVPDMADRFKILQVFRSPAARTPGDELLRNVAAMTHGYTGHDLEQLASKAQVHADLRYMDSKRPTSEDVHTTKEHEQSVSEATKSSSNSNSTPSISLADFESAAKIIRPTAMRELFFEAPRVSWSDIGGSEAVKRALWRVVELPFKHPDIMAISPFRPPRGVILYGPPGCSKTLTAKAIASSSGLNFISIKGAELTSMYVGETERALRDIFRKAQTAAPSVIFFDEIDAIASGRGGGRESTPGLNVVTTLLTEMDGMQALRDVLVLAATNRPDVLDPALLRPGRFDAVLYVPPPPVSARRQILAIHTKHAAFGDLDLDDLALKTEGFSGAEIVEVCNLAAGVWTERMVEAKLQMAAETAVQNDTTVTGESKVSSQDFEQALSQVHKVITPEMLQRYEDWAAKRRDIAVL